MQKRLNIIGLVVLLASVIVAGRLMPHMPNFTPVAAIAIFAGYFFRSKWLALAVPMLGMLVSDLLFAGVYNYATMAVVWAALAAPAFLGPWLRKPVRLPEDAPKWKSGLMRFLKLFIAAGSTSVVFFVASNMAVWLFGGMYALNAGGLTACFAAAIPFFKFTLAGNLAFTFGIFGAWSLFRMWQPRAELRHAIS